MRSGGYGSPLDRPIADVAEDARQGYISLTAARDCYGFALAPETFAADIAASERLRASMRPTPRGRESDSLPDPPPLAGEGRVTASPAREAQTD